MKTKKEKIKKLSIIILLAILALFFCKNVLADWQRLGDVGLVKITNTMTGTSYVNVVYDEVEKVNCYVLQTQRGGSIYCLKTN